MEAVQSRARAPGAMRAQQGAEAQKGGQAGTGCCPTTPPVSNHPSCLSLASPRGAGQPPMLPITLLPHYWHQKEVSAGMVNLNPVGSGVQETCSGVYQPLQSQNRKPPQLEIAAGSEQLCCGYTSHAENPAGRGEAGQTPEGSPAPLQDPRKAAVDTAPAAPGTRQGGLREHPEPTALPTHTPSCLALQRQDIPTSTTALPSRMQERAVRQLGLTVNGTTCSLRGNSSAGRGHGDTWEQGLGHLLPVSCEEGQA